AQTFALGLAATFTTSNLGVVAVLLLASTPLAVAPLLVLTVVLVTAYRAYMSERSRRYSVEFLYNASQVMQGPELNRALVELLGHAREMFHADMAEVLVVTDEPDERIHRTTLGPGNDVQAMTATASPLSEAALRVGRSHQGATLLSKARGEMVPAGFKDAMVAPMRGEKKILGVLVVANPVGAVAGFDGDQLRLFETLASHVALTLENGRLEDSVAQLRELEKKLSFQAYHDPLTRLGNRALFRTRLEESIGRQGGGSRRMAVMFVDLDDFKTVNDSLGHDAGDQLLTIVGERITGCVRPMDLAARLGGDEFGIFLEDVDRADAARVARRILSAVRSPIVIEGRELFVQTSVGIVTGEHSSSVEEFLRNADMAMYTAKRNGKGCYEFFDPGMSSAVVSRQQLKADLERAVERHEFETHYQCMVDLDTQAVVGVEALVRWQHPDGKKRLPDEFIAMAEETGLIVPMGRQVLNDACMAARSWRDLIPELSVSVNLSARQLDDGPLIEDVCAALRNSGLPPESLILEITESITVADIDATVERLWELKTIGVQLAIDDFGTGYSSLSSLRRLPVDILKIPKPFVDGIGDAPTELAFVQAITRLGQTLRLELVAEGIEREDQYKRLKGLKCNVGQGFFFGRPVPVDVMTEFLREESLKQRRSAGLPAAAAAADDDGPSAVVIPLRAQA
ncbi:MAG TPA: EAL domain-containing protein, partial [Acidimicrobiales bacterium]|nr:EAL domain-containing protein [Acidimicrobiales bacterium]